MQEHLLLLKTFLLETDKRLWIGLAVLIVALFLIRKVRKHFRLIKTFQTEVGEVYVTQKALIKAIANICTTLGLMIPPKVKVGYGSRKLHLRLYIKLDPEQSFGKLSISLQENIQQMLVQYLGLEQNLRIDVILTSIKLRNHLKNQQGAQESSIEHS